MLTNMEEGLPPEHPRGWMDDLDWISTPGGGGNSTVT